MAKNTINGVEVELTTAEETERKRVKDVWTALEADAKAAIDQKKIDAQNGNKKLLDLGLTQAEATALTGYTPS
tara:strand:+ start:237 stop:455 length:219 start_codon:yes stop_codon:yes gene_type:complete